VLLQTGAAYVSTERIYGFYRVILLGMDNVESRARRGKSWRKMPVALCVTEVKCLVNRSLGSGRRPRYRTLFLNTWWLNYYEVVNVPYDLSKDILFVN
jgi:hypothetical protein